jgi:hypothetical protein
MEVHRQRVAVFLDCEVDDSEPFRLYSKLESGEKDVEVRVLVEPEPGKEWSKWWKLVPGSFTEAELTVACAGDPSRRCVRKVVRVYMQPSIKSLLDKVGVRRCVPGASSAEDAIERVYRRHYADRLSKVALGIELAPPGK